MGDVSWIWQTGEETTLLVYYQSQPNGTIKSDWSLEVKNLLGWETLVM